MHVNYAFESQMPDTCYNFPNFMPKCNYMIQKSLPLQIYILDGDGIKKFKV